MRRDNPHDPMIVDILRRLRELETASPLGSSSITRGALRVASNEGLKVEGSAKVSGWLIVTGTERVIGRLEGSGTFDWTGPMNLQGAQSVTGPTTFTGKVNINGDVDINGPLNVLGVWKLTGNGEITGDVNLTGELTAGNVRISPNTAGGQIGFGSGRRIDAGAGFLGLYDGARFIVFNSTGVAIHGGGATITVSANGVRMNLPQVAKAGIPANCVYVGSDGYLYEG